MGVRLFVGGHAGTAAGEPVTLGGDRCFTAAIAPPAHTETANLRYLLDSGAFSDPPERRLDPQAALERQLGWERRAADRWGMPITAEALVSYDELIDEVWDAGERVKRRWSVQDAERAVGVTIEAARYLASQRDRLAPRQLVLSCQGVDHVQYAECAQGVLAYATPDDWLGLGGWCIIGRWQSWLPEYRRTLELVIPAAQCAGIRHVHLFGVLWEPAVAAILWIADQHGMSVSVDSTAPVLAVTRSAPTKAGLRAGGGWRGNVAWWQRHLANIRSSRYYGAWAFARQATLWS